MEMTPKEFAELGDLEALYASRALEDFLRDMGIKPGMSKTSKRRALQPEFDYVWGNVNPEAFIATYGRHAYNEMRKQFGPGFFAKKGEGQGMDELASGFSFAERGGYDAPVNEINTSDFADKVMMSHGAFEESMRRGFGAFYQLDGHGNAVSPGENSPKIAQVVGIDPAGLPVDWKNTKALSEWLRDQYEGKTVTIKDDGTIQQFTGRRLDASAKRRGEQQRQVYAELGEVLRNALYDDFLHADARHAGLQGQRIYYSAVKIGDNYYAVRFKLDVPKAKSQKAAYKDHKIAEIEIAPSLCRSLTRENAYPAQNESAIRGISLSVLKGEVNPSRIEDGVLYHGKTPRGGIRQLDDGRHIVGLFKNKDASTVIHETGHFFLENLREAAGIETAPQWVQEAWGALQKIYGFDTTVQGEAWRAVHERFASEFEAYAREGKAPSPELKTAFEKFREWLSSIYKSVKRLLSDSELSPEARKVFDELLRTATEEEREADLLGYYTRPGAEEAPVREPMRNADGSLYIPDDPFRAADDAAMAGDTTLHASGGTSVPVDPAKPALPQGTARAQDASKLSDVIAALEKAFDLPIRIGKFRDKARGIYKIGPEVIRLKAANNIAIAAHEIGHHLQKLLFGDISDAPLEPFRAELEPIATKPKAGQDVLPEGFAEFVAKYAVNPVEARNLAPNFYAHFEQHLAQATPELGKALLDARAGVERWARQPAALEVLSHVSMEGGKEPGLLRLIFRPETWDSLYANFIDRLWPLKKARELLAAGENLPADMDPYILARTFQGVKGKATHFLERSPFRFHTWENVGKPLAEIYRAAENLREEIASFF